MNSYYNNNYNITKKPSFNNNFNGEQDKKKFNAEEHINTFMNNLKNK